MFYFCTIDSRRFTVIDFIGRFDDTEYKRFWRTMAIHEDRKDAEAPNSVHALPTAPLVSAIDQVKGYLINSKLGLYKERVGKKKWLCIIAKPQRRTRLQPLRVTKRSMRLRPNVHIAIGTTVTNKKGLLSTRRLDTTPIPTTYPTPPPTTRSTRSKAAAAAELAE
ncbi:hypothetical protein BJV82DRAFT_154641 [Fennellomyces sp. T-0311]|nr:hypothetical protein BJV82DRAFT_154641 [Fennellomyces sp. T-0311]